MTLIKAAKLAKELDGVIVDVEEGDGFDDVCLNTVKYVRDQLAALNRAIAEAEQPEDVVTCDTSEKRVDETVKQRHDTTPPQRKPLTSDELVGLLKLIDPATARLPIGFARFARAIEAAHGIKE